MSSNYTQYLGAKRCCDLKVQGPQGSQGAQGAAAVGPVGYQGATGAQGYQGATGRGCKGPTGAQGFQGATGAQGFQGATGSSTPWIPMNGYGAGGTAGYTGIGITGQDVLIYGNLLVTGGIDPIYLALTPQTSGPQGFINPLWVDGNAYLRSEKILLGATATPLLFTQYSDTNITATDATGSPTYSNTFSAGSISLSNTTGVSSTIQAGQMTISDTLLNTLTIDKNNITHSNATTPLQITSNKDININTTGIVGIGDVSAINNGTTIVIDDTTQKITMSNQNFTTVFEVNCNTGKIAVATDNGFQLLGTSIQYPSDYKTLSATLDTTSLYAQTFNGTSITATLPLVDVNNVGFQYLITNTNASNLTVSSTGGQLIYSSTGVASNASRTLNVGHSQIFTAIRTTGASTFGWSMV